MAIRIFAGITGIALVLVVFGGLSENWGRSRRAGGVIKSMIKKPWGTLDLAARCVVALVIGYFLMIYAIHGHL